MDRQELYYRCPVLCHRPLQFISGSPGCGLQHVKHLRMVPDPFFGIKGIAFTNFWAALPSCIGLRKSPEVDGPVGQWLIAGCNKSIVEALKIATCSPVA